MIFQLIFFVLIIGVLFINLNVGSRLYYHLLIKQDYDNWAADEDYDNLQSLLGSDKFKKLTFSLFIFVMIASLVINFAIYRLSYYFSNDWLTHLALTEFFVAILSSIGGILAIPIRGVTTIKVTTGKSLLLLCIDVTNDILLIWMLVFGIILH